MARPPLSRESIAARAVELIHQEGMDKLSMRRLGKTLGVEAMSLYHYVQNKDDLLDAVVDQLYSQLTLPDLPPEEWETSLMTAFHSMFDVLVANPGAIDLTTSRSGRTPITIGMLYWGCSQFVHAGLDDDEAIAAFRIVVAYVLGFAASQIGVFGGIEGRKLQLDVSDSDDEGLKRLVAANEELDPQLVFASGLDTVMTGVKERYRL